MKPTLKAGLVLGILVEIWTYINGVAGWYKDPALTSLFYLVILIEIGVLIWGLRMTAPGKTYWGQVGAGTLIAVIGAVVVFIGSYLFTAVVFPSYFDEMRAMAREALGAQGFAEEEIRSRLAMSEPMMNHFASAALGAVMTVVTGFVASLIIAIFIKGKPAETPQPQA